RIVRVDDADRWQNVIRLLHRKPIRHGTKNLKSARTKIETKQLRTRAGDTTRYHLLNGYDPDLIRVQDPYTACPLVHLERRYGSQSSGPKVPGRWSQCE
ncbi:hypothetical protein K439DRAFT_1643386, partial [Ramaria rubella]